MSIRIPEVVVTGFVTELSGSEKTRSADWVFTECETETFLKYNE